MYDEAYAIIVSGLIFSYKCKLGLTSSIVNKILDPTSTVIEFFVLLLTMPSKGRQIVLFNV